MREYMGKYGKNKDKSVRMCMKEKCFKDKEICMDNGVS
jgi:hypothetical protein